MNSIMCMARVSMLFSLILFVVDLINRFLKIYIFFNSIKAHNGTKYRGFAVRTQLSGAVASTSGAQTADAVRQPFTADLAWCFEAR